jgi:hypothetical protein
MPKTKYESDSESSCDEYYKKDKKEKKCKDKEKKKCDCECSNNINCLRGPPGPSGSQGLVGPRGERGDVGPRGERGLQGIQGPQGQKGEQGMRGERGPIGLTGPTGPKGDQGIQGIVGPRGERGLIGPVGPMGPRGYDGQPGSVGPQGHQGEQGIQGCRGNDGQQGPPGRDGNDGEKGERGDKGETGDQGIQGIGGPVGPKGDQGDTASMHSIFLYSKKKQTVNDTTEYQNLVFENQANGPGLNEWSILTDPNNEINAVEALVAGWYLVNYRVATDFGQVTPQQGQKLFASSVLTVNTTEVDGSMTIIQSEDGKNVMVLSNSVLVQLDANDKLEILFWGSENQINVGINGNNIGKLPNSNNKPSEATVTVTITRVA